MKKKRGVLGRLILGLGAVILLVLAASGVVGSILNRRQVTEAEPFRFTPNADNRFAAVGDGLAVASSVTMELFGPDGAARTALTRGYPSPLLAAEGENAVVWGDGGTAATVLLSDGANRELSFQTPLLAADVNGIGWSVFLNTEKGYKGCATVYQPDGAAVYQVHLGSSYPIDGDLSPTADRMALLSLLDNGSRVTLYALNAESPVAEWSAENESFLELEYLEDGRLLLLSTDRAVFLDRAGKLLGSFGFQQEFLKDYQTGGDGFVTLVLGKHKTGNAGRILTLDHNGSLLSSLDISEEVRGLSAAGKGVAALFGDRTVLYDELLAVTGTLDSTAGTQAALMRSDGSALILSGMGAAIYEP